MRKLMLVCFMAVLLSIVPAKSFAAELLYNSQAQDLNKLGLYLGVNADKFEPALDRSVTRQEAFVMIVRLFGVTQKNEANVLPSKEESRNLLTEKFSDGGDIPDWAQRYVAYGIKSNYINGYPDGTIKGKALITARAYCKMIVANLGYEFEYLKAGEVFLKATSTFGDDQKSKSFVEDTEMKRDLLVGITYTALDAYDPKREKNIATKLVEQGAIEEKALKNLSGEIFTNNNIKVIKDLPHATVRDTKLEDAITKAFPDIKSEDISYQYNLVDLNNDGKPEIVASISFDTISGDGYIGVFREKDGKYEKIGMFEAVIFYGSVRVCDTLTNSWKDLIIGGNICKYQTNEYINSLKNVYLPNTIDELPDSISGADIKFGVGDNKTFKISNSTNVSQKVFPVLISDYIIGGVNDLGVWLDNNEIFGLSSGTEKYRVYGDNTFMGEYIGVKKTSDEFGNNVIKLNNTEAYNVAIASDKDLYWKKLESVPVQTKEYEDIASKFLKSQGVDSEPVIKSIDVVDIDGDNKKDAIMILENTQQFDANNSKSQDFGTIEPFKDAYSYVILSKSVDGVLKNIILDKNLNKKGEKVNMIGDQALRENNVKFVGDIDGDGTMEVLVSYMVFETNGVKIFDIIGDAGIELADNSGQLYN